MKLNLKKIMEKIHELKSDEKLNIAIVGGGLVSFSANNISKFSNINLWTIVHDLVIFEFVN